MDETFDMELRLKYPDEARVWQAIRHTLKSQSFTDFHMWLGECPPGHELRPKRDGRRAPFEASHFEWLPRETPKRIDTALKAVSGAAGMQSQIDALREEMARGFAELRSMIQSRAKVPVFVPQAVAPENWCVIDTGQIIGRYQIDQGPTDRRGLVSVHTTEDEAQSAVMALINGGSDDQTRD